MDLIVRLAALGDPEVAELSVNRESIFDFAKFDAVRDALGLVLRSKKQRSDAEAAFLASWLAGFADASQFLSKIADEDEKEAPSDAAALRLVAAAGERIRAVMKNPSELATAYKILFLTALHSRREPLVLHAMLQELRRSLGLDRLVYFLISDGIARALPQFPYRPTALSLNERELVAGLACHMLQSDSTSHSDERIMFRLVLASLELPGLTAAQLAKVAKEKPQDLIAALGDSAKQSVAIVTLLRMMLADQRAKTAEQELLTAAVGASKLTAADVVRLTHFATLESAGS